MRSGKAWHWIIIRPAAWTIRRRG